MQLWTSERLLKLVIFACFLMVAALTVVFVQQNAINDRIDSLNSSQEEFKDVQTESRDRNRQVKGIVCRIEYAIGLESSPVCTTPKLLEQYWSPENSVSPHFPERS